MKCNICSSENFLNRIGSCRDRNDIYPVECLECGLVSLSSTDHITNYYYESSSMHEHKTVDQAIIDAQAIKDADRRFLSLKSKLKNSLILDYGCGSALWWDKALLLTSCIIGVELEKSVRESVKEKGFEVYKTLNDIQKDRKYNIITLFHVLEHLADPLSILKNLMEILSNDGTLIIETPNANDALLSLYQNTAFADFTYWSCHLYLYSMKSLELLISKAGLKIVNIGQVQRYPLSNHLYWLAQGKPGGHDAWALLNSKKLEKAYSAILEQNGMCDTIWAELSVN